MKLVRRDNHDICIEGTLETLKGRANILSGEYYSDGTINIEYSGGTEIFYDDQTTDWRDGQRVFLDENGEEVLEKDVELIDENESED